MFVRFLFPEMAVDFCERLRNGPGLAIRGQKLSVEYADVHAPDVAKDITALGLRNCLSRTIQLEGIGPEWSEDDLRTQLQYYGLLENVDMNRGERSARASFFTLQAADTVSFFHYSLLYQ